MKFLRGKKPAVIWGKAQAVVKFKKDDSFDTTDPKLIKMLREKGYTEIPDPDTPAEVAL